MAITMRWLTTKVWCMATFYTNRVNLATKP